MIFFMEQNISIQEHFKIILYLYQLSESIGGNLNKYDILHGTKYFYSGTFQNHFVFIPTIRIYWWKSNGL